MSDHEPVIGSLCSGYGGLDLGVQAVLGGRVAWHVEYDRDPSKILAHHWPDIPNHGDVKTTEWANVEPVDVLTAGYPCQPFSNAGLRKGANDPRHLWPDVARAVGALRPRLVVLENVRGHVSLGLADVLADLSDLGYDAAWGLVRASDAGAPHARARIFIVATPNAGRGQLEGAALLRDGLPVVAERGDDAPDPEGNGREGGDARGSATERSGSAVPAGPPADADGASIVGGAPGGRDAVHGDVGGIPVGRDSARPVDEIFPTPTPFQLGNSESPEEWITRRADVVRRTGTHHGLPLTVAAWSIAEGNPIRLSNPTAWDPDAPPVHDFGPYAGAVDRWARILGRPAPAPTDVDGETQRPRLSPAFVEWMMGLDPGHVTDTPGLSQNAALKALGNGVVPAQAALALRALLPILTSEGP